MIPQQIEPHMYSQGFMPVHGEPPNESRYKHPKARIIQFSDPNKTLPDGSKVVYAENEDKITLYKKRPQHPGTAYVYMRKTGDIYVNGKKGSAEDQRTMLQIGKYLMENARESDMVTINLN